MRNNGLINFQTQYFVHFIFQQYIRVKVFHLKLPYEKKYTDDIYNQVKMSRMIIEIGKKSNLCAS